MYNVCRKKRANWILSTSSLPNTDAFGGICNNHIIANCPQSVPVKEFIKSVSNWRRCGQKWGGRFLWRTTYVLNAAIAEARITMLNAHWSLSQWCNGIVHWPSYRRLQTVKVYHSDEMALSVSPATDGSRQSKSITILLLFFTNSLQHMKTRNTS